MKYTKAIRPELPNRRLQGPVKTQRAGRTGKQGGKADLALDTF